MNPELQNVLDEIITEFRPTTVEANILFSKLQAGGYLVQEECDEIESTPMTTKKFIVSVLLL